MKTKTNPDLPISEQSEGVGSPGSSLATPPIPQSEIPNPQSRRAALDEAAKIIGQDMVNSCEQIAHFCRADNPEQVRNAYLLYLRRARKAHQLLATVVDDLPIVNEED